MPFGAFECLTLPMGVMPASNLFQARMIHIFAPMKNLRPFPYIDDVLHFKGQTFEEHLSILDEILRRIGEAGLLVSADKSRFCQECVEYLGFLLKRTGYEPMPSRISVILRINPPKDVSGARSLLGVVNYIKNHIPHRAKICEPINRLTRKDVKFVWGEEQQNAFEKLKALVLEAILLTYPNPNRPFDLYPYASQKYAMGAVIAQDGKIVSTFSRKFNEAQLKYTVTRQELFAAVEACKHFDQIIRGCEIRILKISVNLREQRARIFLDSEYAPEFVHIAGEDNTEFMEMLESYGITSKPTTVKNTTANAVVERIHGTLGEQLRATIFGRDWSYDVDTLIEACAYALRAASPARGTYSPAQLVFGYDMIFRQKVLIDWERVKALRVRFAAENNAKESKKQREHTYKVGDKVLLVLKPHERLKKGKILPSTHSRGPFNITEVIANGTVKIQCGAYVDVVSIRRITPYIQRK
jgi:hypothetical protein